MLVIKAEIWPRGSVEDRFEIARIGIINRGNAHTLADYNIIGILERDVQESLAEGFVLAHRRSSGWEKLTVRALGELVPSPSVFHPEYTQAVVDLLKRG